MLVGACSSMAMFSHEGVHLNDSRQGDRHHPRSRGAVRRAVPRARDDHKGCCGTCRYVFVVVFAIMAVLVIPHAHLSTSRASKDSWWIWTTGLVLIVSAGWPRLDRERRRLLALPPGGHIQGEDVLGGDARWRHPLDPPRAARRRRIHGELVGGRATHGPGAAAVPTAFASWFFWPFLILALPQLFAINTHRHVLLGRHPAGDRHPGSSGGSASSSTPSSPVA